MLRPLFVAVLGIHCGSAAGPEFEVQPPPTAAADVLCVDPGFARDVGQARFRLVDMDLGRSCEVFLEQDVCVLAIFDDCTDPSSQRREWQGQALTNRTVRLAPLYPDDATGVIIPRAPACCEGPVFPSTGATEWMRLDCRFSSCNNGNRAHTGLFLTRDVLDAPAFRATASEAVTAATTGANAVDALWDPDRGEGWLGWTNRGLYVRAADGDATPIESGLPAGHLAQNSQAVFAGGGLDLARVDKAQRVVTRRANLPGALLAMTYVPEGLLVAVDGTMSDRPDRPQSLLVLYATDTLEPTLQSTHDGRLTGLAAGPTGGIAVATFDDPPRLEVIDRALSAAATIAMSALRELSVDNVSPSKPIMLAPNRVGFIAPCFEEAGNAGKIHCFYEHLLDNPDGERSERIGVPDEDRLADVAISHDGSLVWLTGAEGRVHQLERTPVRPQPQALTIVDHDVDAIVTVNNDIWVLSANAGRLTILTPR